MELIGNYQISKPPHLCEINFSEANLIFISLSKLTENIYARHML